MPPASGLVWVAMPPIRIFQRHQRRRIVPINIIRIIRIITAMAVARTTAVLTVADIMAAAATAAGADITDFIFR